MSAEELFNKIISEVPGAKPGKMFGALCAKMENGKAGMMLKNDDLIVKISDETAKENGFKNFSPMENKPMNGWFVIPFEQKKIWGKFAKISCEEVAKLPANKKK